jgi:hypothetical protein
MITNAKITRTMLGVEDHGIMTFMLSIEWDGGVAAGFGGIALDRRLPDDTRVATGDGRGYQAIRQVLEVVGVHTWEKLPGQLIRIDEDGTRVQWIGHIIEDRWFDIRSVT